MIYEHKMTWTKMTIQSSFYLVKKKHAQTYHGHTVYLHAVQMRWTLFIWWCESKKACQWGQVINLRREGVAMRGTKMLLSLDGRLWAQGREEGRRGKRGNSYYWLRWSHRTVPHRTSQNLREKASCHMHVILWGHFLSYNIHHFHIPRQQGEEQIH